MAETESGPNLRSVARLAAVQALYQMDISGTGVDTVINEYETHRIGKEIDGAQYGKADRKFFRAIVEGVLKNQTDIDPVVNGILDADWPIFRVDSIIRAILRAGAFEVTYRKDVPVKASINEYLNVADAFFGAEEKRLINAVLDKVAREAGREVRAKS